MNRRSGARTLDLLSPAREAAGRMLPFFLLAIVFGPAAVLAQIVVTGNGLGYNRFGIGADINPIFGGITDARDVFGAFDFEIDGQMYVRGDLFLYPQQGNFHQYLYFANQASVQGEWLYWHFGAPGNGSFRLSDDLLLESAGTNDDVLRFYADRDGNGSDRGFRWYIGDPSVAANQVMDLDHAGNLQIAGVLGENQVFSDLAESFWMSLPVASGEVVAIDPQRPDAVVPAARAADPRIVGVVATRPAISLGWGVVSVESLRGSWGDEAADLFQRDRSRLESEALAMDPDLQRTAARLSEAAALRSEGTIDFELSLERAALDLFFQERVAQVALAGRVPVKADASFGPILIGDPLTSSPVAGKAMKAAPGDPIVGIALEVLPTGQGEVMVLVQPGWAPESGVGEVARLRRELAERKRQVSALAERLYRLESALVRVPRPCPECAEKSAHRLSSLETTHPGGYCSAASRR